jgi:hypothetical protein
VSSNSLGSILVPRLRRRLVDLFEKSTLLVCIGWSDPSDSELSVRLAYHEESIWVTFGYLGVGLSLVPRANSFKLRSVDVNILQSFLQKVIEQQIPKGLEDIGI